MDFKLGNKIANGSISEVWDCLNQEEGSFLAAKLLKFPKENPIKRSNKSYKAALKLKN